jgi:hypothetical protein
MTVLPVNYCRNWFIESTAGVPFPEKYPADLNPIFKNHQKYKSNIYELVIDSFARKFRPKLNNRIDRRSSFSGRSAATDSLSIRRQGRARPSADTSTILIPTWEWVRLLV